MSRQLGGWGYIFEFVEGVHLMSRRSMLLMSFPEFGLSFHFRHVGPWISEKFCIGVTHFAFESIAP